MGRYKRVQITKVDFRKGKKRRPPLPKNENFWYFVAQKPKEVKAFMERGSDDAKRALKKMLRFLEWERKQKEE